MWNLFTERITRRALIAIALAGLVFGALSWANGNGDLANWCSAAGTVPVLTVLLVSMLRDLFAGRFGVDSIAFLSMAAAVLLGQNLAGIIIASQAKPTCGRYCLRHGQVPRLANHCRHSAAHPGLGHEPAR